MASPAEMVTNVEREKRVAITAYDLAMSLHLIGEELKREGYPRLEQLQAFLNRSANKIEELRFAFSGTPMKENGEELRRLADQAAALMRVPFTSPTQLSNYVDAVSRRVVKTIRDVDQVPRR